MVFVLWAFGLIFFRAESLPNAFAVIGRLGDWSQGMGAVIIRDGMKELGVLNFGLLSNPYNWVTVFLMTAFALLLLHILTRSSS